MEILVIVIGAVLITVGFFTSFLPMISGPLISYCGLLVLQLGPSHPFDLQFFIIWGLLVILLMILDNVIPAYGTKRLGGSAYGIWGSIVGAIAGTIFFAPVGIILGPLLGAFIGELIGGQTSGRAFKSALGSFAGFLFHTLLKAVASGVMGYYFIISAL